MSLISKSEVKNLLKKYQIRPSRKLGQNFLINKGVLKEIIKTAQLSPNDIILEIGPAVGVLTKELAKKAGKVITIEKDLNLTRILDEELKIANIKNVEIVKGDILKMDLKIYNLRPKNYKIVANIPYYLTSPLIRKFLETENQPKEMTLMVQKEVAQRICAKPPDMNLLAVSVQFSAKPEIISYVSKESFWPQPKVDSAIIKISNIKRRKLKISPDLFFKIVKAGFSQPRKQLVNNLSGMLKLKKGEVKSWLLKNNIQPHQRAQTLKIDDWLKLASSSYRFICYNK